MIYKIKNFTINTESREIFNDGKALTIEPKVYDLIIYFIKNPNKALSKDQLQDDVWPGVEVSETAITRAVMKARKVINDGNDVHSYIKTVHGHGYKFVAEVSVEEKSTNENSNNDYWWLRNKKPLTFLVAIVLATIFSVSFILINKPVMDEDSKLAVLPVINKTNNKEFSWASIGLMSLAVQMLKAENGISTISNSASSRIKDIKINDNFQIAESELNSLKDKLKATHLVFSMLENSNDDQFKLRYSVFHPQGKQDVIELVGKNPTELTQKMVKQITNKLPNASITTPKYRAISDNVFTNELYARGVAHRLEGKAKSAREYFSLVMKEEPDLFWPRYQYALTSNKLGKYDEAIEALEKLLIDIPKILNDKDLEAGVNNAIGISYMYKSDHLKGIEYYSNAYEISKASGNRDYQEKIASNIAWIYKDKRDFEKSKIWLAKSNESREGLDLPPNINNIYLKGQLEFLVNNFDKAETIFAEAYQLYIDANLNRQAAKVLNIRARVQNLKGNWKKAHEIADQSLELSEKVDDDLGRLDSYFMRTQVLMNEGKYKENLDLIQQNITKSEEINQIKKIKNWKQQEINSLFHLKEYDLALEKLDSYPKREKPLKKGQVDNMHLKKLQIEYIQGNQQALLDWISEFKDQDSPLDNKDQNRVQNLNLFMLETNNPISNEPLNSELADQMIEAYREAINVENQLGFQASVAKKLIKIAKIKINQNDNEGFLNVLNELQFYELDWWQIDLLKAYKYNLNQENNSAIELANQAKNRSTDTWDSFDQHLFESIVK